MLIILLGLLLAAIVTIILMALKEDYTFFISICIVLCAVFISLFGAQKYTEYELKDEIPLYNIKSGISLEEENSNAIYVALSEDGKYSYRYSYNIRNEQVFLTTSIKESVNVIEEESEECEKPVLKVYVKKGIPTKWMLATFSKRKQYVFYVPKGTISHYYDEDYLENFEN